MPVPLALVPAPDHRTVSDSVLAQGLQAEEAWALGETWRRFAPMVITMATRALGSPTEAEDLAQEVFSRVFRKASSLRDPSTLRSFVFSFAIRVLKTELRRKKARRWLSFHAPDAIPSDPASLDVNTHLARSTDLESRDLLRRFYGLLERLGTRDRLVFSLRYLEHLTVEEIAEATELSTSTVKRSLAHATSKLSVWVERDLGMKGSWMGRMEA